MRAVLLLLLVVPFIGTAQTATLQASSKVIVDDGYDYTELSVTPWGGSHGIFFGSKVNYTGSDHLWSSGNAVYAHDAGQYSYGAFSMGYIANGGQFSFYDGGLSTGAGDQITWNPVMTIMRGGNVGIGTTPAYKLDVWGISRSKSYFVDAGQTSYSGDYQFRSSDTYRGRFIWYSSAYSGLSSNSITVENPTGVHIADFFENGNTAFGGNVAIGTTNDHGYKLAVNGNVLAQKIRITQTGWPDYVFHPTYKLLSLKELESYIQKNNHLPEIPSACEVENNGLDLGDNQTALLKKIEELTLYIIDQEKTIKEQNKKIEFQQHQIGAEHQELLDLKKELEIIKTKLQINN